MPVILFSLCFFFLTLFLFLSFCYFAFPTLLFLILAHVMLWCDGCVVILWLSLWLLLLCWWCYCAWRRLLIYCLPWLVPFHPLTTFVWMWVSFQTIHWFVSCSATTMYLCWLCHIPLPDKEFYFVCLFTVAFPSEIGWVFSLTIPHVMHLVVLTHPSLFWVVCHLSRTFPPKWFEWEP